MGRLLTVALSIRHVVDSRHRPLAAVVPVGRPARPERRRGPGRDLPYEDEYDYNSTMGGPHSPVPYSISSVPYSYSIVIFLTPYYHPQL
eukprot:scaffold156365_cov36-Prasinocladus_malaysianus.AAC.1